MVEMGERKWEDETKRLHFYVGDDGSRWVNETETETEQLQ